MLVKGTYPKVNPSMIRDLMEDIFESDPELIKKVRELARATHEENWWEAYRPGMADNQWLRIQRQERASHIISHHHNGVPTLAQSVDYLEALFEALKIAPQLHDVDLDAAFRLRLDRLERWEDSERPLTCLIGEAALKTDLGPGVAETQIQRLLYLHDLPHAQIWVLPFSAGHYSVMDYEFDILEFDDGQESLVCVSGLNHRYLTSMSRNGSFFWAGLHEAKNKAITIKEYVHGSG